MQHRHCAFEERWEHPIHNPYVQIRQGIPDSRLHTSMLIMPHSHKIHTRFEATKIVAWFEEKQSESEREQVSLATKPNKMCQCICFCTCHRKIARSAPRTVQPCPRGRYCSIVASPVAPNTRRPIKTSSYNAYLELADRATLLVVIDVIYFSITFDVQYIEVPVFLNWAEYLNLSVLCG